MTERNPALWIQARTDHTAEQDRQLLRGLVQQAGVVKTDDLKVQAKSTPNMSVDVLLGQAFVAGTEGAHQSYYACYNDATVNLVISSSSPTLPRIDIVVAKVQDAAYSGATNAWSLAVVTGTPAASPAAPSAPANALILAQVAVAANATTITNANITDTRTRTSAVGGVVVTTSGARPGSPYTGQKVFETDTLRFSVYDGSTWQTATQLGAWTAYTPTWTASSTNPSLGNGTLTGAYIQIGKTVHYRIRLRAGSTTTFGSGVYRFSLPVTTVATFAGAGEIIGQASLLDNSASSRYVRNAYTYDDTKVSLVDEGGTGVSNSVPFTFATLDNLSIVGTYEAA